MHDYILFNLRDNASRYGVTISEYQLKCLDRYVNELIFWNRKMNLTGISSRDRIFDELVLDSIIPTHSIADEGFMLDVGSGAGFPAIPIKVFKPLLKIHLIESNTKKVSFLKQVIRLLGLHNIDVIRGRIEMDSGMLNHEGYDIVTARSFANLGDTIKICSSFVVHGGHLFLFQGRYAGDELLKNRIKMHEYSMKINQILPYFTPVNKSLRHIIQLTKGPEQIYQAPLNNTNFTSDT